MRRNQFLNSREFYICIMRMSLLVVSRKVTRSVRETEEPSENMCTSNKAGEKDLDFSPVQNGVILYNYRKNYRKSAIP